MQLNVSEEIARFIHLEMLKAGAVERVIEKLPIVLMYNLDKERLEEALRKKLVLRMLDTVAFDAGRERALS